MRSFFYRLSKNLTGIYMICWLVLSYRLVYNEFYFEIHEDIEASMSKEQEVYPSGEIVGIYTQANGIFVIDTCEIETPEGNFVNPVGFAIQAGDYILEIDGRTLESKEDMMRAVKESQGEPLEFTISRNGEIRKETITPVYSKNETYMVGIWMKDDLAGVGTITYVTVEGEFAALGHGMGNGENNDLLEVKKGDVYTAEVIGIQKGERGTPGEIKGVIKYGERNHIGEVSANSGQGIYGVLDEEDEERYCTEEVCQIAQKQEIQLGPAQIVTEVSGEKKYYDIAVTYVDYLAVNSNKGIHIKVTDSQLLELTGGIIQGLSGSPIIQNGKLIGAVTHVLINDPTSGYGIFIEEMLEH